MYIIIKYFTNLDYEDKNECDVEEDEEEPEYPVVGEDANDLEDERYPNGQEDQVCCAGHVMMAELVNLNMVTLNIEDFYTSF